MRVLFVASYNKGYYAPFILEQAEALRILGCEVKMFGVTGKGIRGYLKCLPELRENIKGFQPDIIHAHYGLCGLLAGLQRRIPVVTTFHGSDINEKKVLPFSKIAIRLSRFNIFVSQNNIDIAGPRKEFTLIPCGVNLADLQLVEKEEACKRMGLDHASMNVLFAGAFDNPVKNFPLAKAAMENLQGTNIIELKGYSRKQVNLLMCAVDCLLLTSHSEGSPQVIKEAMACNCPIVSVDVGDVSNLISGLEGCLLANADPDDIAVKLKKAIALGRTNGRDRITKLQLDNHTIATRILAVYDKVLGNERS